MAVDRRSFLALSAAAVTSAVLPRLVHSEPLNSARLLTGFPPGTTPDVLARLIGEKLAAQGYSRSVIIENRTGAGGQLAVSAVKGAPADGSAILLTPMSMLGLYPFTYKRLPTIPSPT